MLLYEPNAVLGIRSWSHFFYQCTAYPAHLFSSAAHVYNSILWRHPFFQISNASCNYALLVWNKEEYKSLLNIELEIKRGTLNQHFRPFMQMIWVCIWIIAMTLQLFLPPFSNIAETGAQTHLYWEQNTAVSAIKNNFTLELCIIFFLPLDSKPWMYISLWLD